MAGDMKSAASSGEGNAMQALALKVRTEAILQATQEGCSSAFQRAVANSSVEEIQMIKDDLGRCLLHHAAQKGHTSLCRKLVEDLGLDVNSQDTAGGSTHVELGVLHWQSLR